MSSSSSSSTSASFRLSQNSDVATLPKALSVAEDVLDSSLRLYTLTNENGYVLRVINYGATIVQVLCPDKTGRVADVVIGFDDVHDYTKNSMRNFNSIVGRYANRIADAKFVLEGHEYKLAANNGRNSLHGGPTGFYSRYFAGSVVKGDGWIGVELKYKSGDGEEGFPGELQTTVIYKLTRNNSIVIEMLATTNATTIVNLCNHAYWNLASSTAVSSPFHPSPNVLSHHLTLNCSQYTPVNDNMIPTGELRAVSADPHLDFELAKPLAKHIDAFKGNAALKEGYDHNFVVNSNEDKHKATIRGRGADTIGVTNDQRFAACLFDADSGRGMEVYTTAPGIQCYSGNWLDASVIAGKNGAVYNKNAGVCLETQAFPDSPNQPNFPSVVVKPGQRYRHVATHHFFAQ